MNDLPLELVREILRFSSKADLATLSSVNATLNEIATPLLYVVLAAKNLSRMLRALRTLRAKPQLARFVRIFRLPDGTVFKSALRIVAESLRMMENLVELSLCLGGQYTYVLHGCISTPRVVDFSFVYDRHLGEWLRRSGQNIEDFRMLNLEQPVFTSPVSNSLPSVTSVYAVPQLIIALAGDRPIREAGILAVNGDWSHLTLAALLSSLATLSRSSSTVRTIMIATHIMFFVDAIIYFLPKCRVLKLHMLWTAIPSDKSLLIQQTLTRLSALKTKLLKIEVHFSLRFPVNRKRAFTFRVVGGKWEAKLDSKPFTSFRAVGGES